MDIDVAREKIANEIDYIDLKPYSHNIISLVLSSVAKEHGQKEANLLIEDFNLEDKGWNKINK